MPIIAQGQHIPKEFLEALGLPKRTRSFTLTAEVGCVVKLQAEFYPEQEGVDKAMQVLSETFELKARK